MAERYIMDAHGGDGPQATTGRLREIRFTFQHDGCWLQETTERFPGLLLVANDLYKQGGKIHLNITLHADDQALRDQAVDTWVEDDRVDELTLISQSAGSSRYHIAYAWEGSIYADLIDHTPVNLGPVQFVDGVEHYHMIGDLEDLRQMVDRLRAKGRLVVTSVTEPSELAGTTETTPWSELTDRQCQALFVAQEAGYYSWPREVSASEAADRIGLSSSAFIEHLRRAEAKVIQAVLEQLAEEAPNRAAACQASQLEATR